MIHNQHPPPSIEGDFVYPGTHQVLALLRDLTFTVLHHHAIHADGVHPEVAYFLAHARAMLYNLSPLNAAKVDKLTSWEAFDDAERESTAAEISPELSTLRQIARCEQRLSHPDKVPERCTLSWGHSGPCRWPHEYTLMRQVES